MTMTHPRLHLTHPMVLRRAYGTGDEGEKLSADLSRPKAAGTEIDDVVVTPTP